MSFEIFREAQAQSHNGFADALAEIQSGRKSRHWIWYIFPQIEGLGRSPIAQWYALPDVEAACEYLQDDELRTNFIMITKAVSSQLDRGVPLATLMGSQIDALKVVSSFTLFEVASQQSSSGDQALQELTSTFTHILDVVELQGYPRCRHTLSYT